MNRNDERVDGRDLEPRDEPGSDSLLDAWVRNRAQATPPSSDAELPHPD